MNLILVLIGVLSLVAVFLFFRSSEILSVAKKRISSSFEDGNNNLNALFGVIFLIISFVGIIWYSYDQATSISFPKRILSKISSVAAFNFFSYPSRIS